MEAEHRVGASKTTGNQRKETQNGQIGGEHTMDDRKAAVIGRSKCTVARKLSEGQHPMGELQYKDGEPALQPSQTSPFRW